MERREIFLQIKSKQLLWSDVNVECDYPLTIWGIRTSLRHQPSHHVGGVVRLSNLSHHLCASNLVPHIISRKNNQERIRSISNSILLQIVQVTRFLL